MNVMKIAAQVVQRIAGANGVAMAHPGDPTTIGMEPTYMRCPTTGAVKQVRGEKLAASMSEQGWVRCEKPEPKRKPNPRDLYWTPRTSMDGW